MDELSIVTADLTKYEEDIQVLMRPEYELEAMPKTLEASLQDNQQALQALMPVMSNLIDKLDELKSSTASKIKQLEQSNMIHATFGDNEMFGLTSDQKEEVTCQLYDERTA